MIDSYMVDLAVSQRSEHGRRFPVPGTPGGEICAMKTVAGSQVIWPREEVL